MKSGLGNSIPTAKDGCAREVLAQSTSLKLRPDQTESALESGKEKSFSLLFGMKPVQSLLTLSALYLSVACSAGGVPDDSDEVQAASTGGGIPTVSADSIPTVDSTDSMFVLSTAVSVPPVVEPPVEEANVVREVSTEVGSTPTVDANPVTLVDIETLVTNGQEQSQTLEEVAPDEGTPDIGASEPVDSEQLMSVGDGNENIDQSQTAVISETTAPESSEQVTEQNLGEVSSSTSSDENPPQTAEPAATEPTTTEPTTAEPTTEPANTEPTINESASMPDFGASSNETQSPVGGTGVSFAEIAADGLPNACYLDDDHYVAEFMYQNPDVCFWELDSANQTVSAVLTPQPPSDAIQLPAPSGGDDTGALESFINARAGESLVGQGTYKVKSLDINVPVDIFNMPMEPASGAGEMVIINSPDVRIFSSPIDAKNLSTVYVGFHVTDGSHRFTLVDSGFSNIHHKNNQNAAGVYIRGADDFYLACNRFENLLNDTNDKQYTARANAIWMNGKHTQSTSGGYIVNNYAYNAQSNGKLVDSEFFTQQSYASTSVDNPVRIFGNRTLDAGKRFTKHQTDNAQVLSNDHEWSEKEGPLGNRLLLAHVTVQFSDNVIARNNRVTVGADSRFDYILITQVHYGTKVQDNIHYDCNDIEIQDQLPPDSNNIPMIITARMTTKPRDSTGFEATNSSANYNRVHGEGSVRYFYNFDHGYDDRGGRFETIGNVFEIDYLNAVYR